LAPVLALVLALALPAPARGGVWCGSHSVGPGDTRAEVTARCGAPVDRVTWRVDVLGPGGGSRLVRRDAEWVYNRGPLHPLGIVRMADGIVTWAGSGNPGFSDTGRVDRRCRMGLFERGEVRARVRGLCGAPADVKAWTERRPGRGPSGGPERVHVRVEAWMYDFGRMHFTRTYTFENGRLARQESGDYGGR
jgi:hypothetical protein